MPFSPRNPGPAGHGGWGRAVAFTLEDGVPSREETDALEVSGYRRLREADPNWEVYDSDENPLDAELTMRGDAGAAQLFGDPVALGRGGPVVVVVGLGVRVTDTANGDGMSSTALRVASVVARCADRAVRP